MVVLQMLTRILAIVGKELVEIVRRPGAAISLIAGPFLIMALFGVGYQGARAPLRTIIVVPPESGLPTDVATYREVTPGMTIEAVVPNADAAVARLEAREVDVVIEAPPDVDSRFRAGEKSQITVMINAVDPYVASYAGVLAAQLSSEVNRRIIEVAVEEGQQSAVAAGRPEAASIPPDVVAEPTEAELVNVAPVEPDVVGFFGPAVLALILQHMAVTLVALSLVRERTSGIIELFRISPVTTGEILIGKVLAYGVLAAALAATTVALLGALGVPLRGDPGFLAAVLALLLLASLGLGILIAVVSDSERQAVQLALLVLLASVFFSGFVLAVEEFRPAVQVVAYLLPVTHGIQLAQDVMLRGWTNAPWHLAALGAIALVLFVVSWLLFRRGMTRL